jgi:tetratricopeptide (TPR) repeat protein
MRRFVAAILVVAGFIFAGSEYPAYALGRRAGLQARLPAEAKSWMPHLSSWLEAVNEHRPGSVDMPARAIGAWTEWDLYRVREDFFALVALYRRELTRPGRLGLIVYKETDLAVADLRKLLGLTQEEAARGNANRILLRAAVLHADVAMLVIPLLPSGAGCSSRATVLVKDGNSIGAGCLGVHWIHSRLLLDALRPDKASDAIARLWYQASTAYMLEIGDYANADPHIEHARLTYPADPGILFEHGMYHEGFAAPQIQTAALESGVDRRGARPHLDEAAESFRKAIKENPYFVEARVHRGFVLGQLGRQTDAAEELREAVDTAQGSQLRYYAELFLGQAEESLGNRAAARDHYARALALYPRAQSPLLALSLLARQFGDRAGAQKAMRQLMTLPAKRALEDDPWFACHRWQNRGYEVLFGELYVFLAGGRQ